MLAKQRETSDPVPGVETYPGMWAAGVAFCEHRPYVWDTSLRMLTCVCPHRSLSRFFLMWDIPGKLMHLRKDWAQTFLYFYYHLPWLQPTEEIASGPWREGGLLGGGRRQRWKLSPHEDGKFRALFPEQGIH